jgi:hypothetical protein
MPRRPMASLINAKYEELCVLNHPSSKKLKRQ